MALFSCIYCFLSQDGSMSKTLRKYSGESFLTYFKDLYRVSFVAPQGEGSDRNLPPEDCEYLSYQCLCTVT